MDFDIIENLNEDDIIQLYDAILQQNYDLIADWRCPNNWTCIIESYDSTHIGTGSSCGAVSRSEADSANNVCGGSVPSACYVRCVNYSNGYCKDWDGWSWYCRRN